MTQVLWKAASLFFGKMVAKLMHMRTVHGYSGWDCKQEDYLIRKLQKNIEEKDWVDVANLAMMLDYRKGK